MILLLVAALVSLALLVLVLWALWNADRYWRSLRKGGR